MERFFTPELQVTACTHHPQRGLPCTSLVSTRSVQRRQRHEEVHRGCSRDVNSVGSSFDRAVLFVFKIDVHLDHFFQVTVFVFAFDSHVLSLVALLVVTKGDHLWSDARSHGTVVRRTPRRCIVIAPVHIVAVSDAVCLVVEGSIGLRLRRWYVAGTGCHRVPRQVRLEV